MSTMPTMPTSAREARLERLFSRTHAGVKPGLELMEALLEALGRPQDRFLCVHVAGTNGKGSVCALMASVLRTAGLRTGLFTSPHLLRVNERIQIEGAMVADAVLDRLLDQIDDASAQLPREATFFEVLTALAFLAFAESGVQVAVLETGMGGRLDCTNVVTPLVSVITRVDFDHMQWLGDTLTAIAGEKAGIIKPGRPVVVAPQAAEVMQVLKTAADARGSDFLESGERVSLSGRRQDLSGQSIGVETSAADYGRVRIPLLGAFQMEALATSVCALEQIFSILGGALPAGILKEGLGAVVWPARCQVLQESPPLILDVAHNPAGAAALVDTLKALFGRKARGVFLVGQMADKDAVGFLRQLRPTATLCLCTATDTPRAMPGPALAALAEREGMRAEAVALPDARERLMRAMETADFGCVAGSVYLAGAWLGGVQDPGERF